ncbi:RelA/SpoT domain-containing protein [Dietzia sp. Die43]|uniref:RelA/SpoT domain-containing protein n=1 Tax=Dietzia sp. Die43 TaxID=2926011 RepID=UPI002119A249|nr:RelA/SpoT domain-containing protein [Dietzia sp. Die43]
MELPSKTRIRKSGELIRSARFDPDTPHDITQLGEALDVVKLFRRAHQEPMAKVRNGLTSMVNTLGFEPVITQRLKRSERIIRKLHRSVGSSHGRTTLDRLEDIGGVRVILPDQAAVQLLADRINRRWNVHRDRDYVKEPQPTGYWARHIVVIRDARFVEIQLRTPWEQSWADAVEAADNRLALTLKDGIGPESMITYFALAANQLRARELGHTVDRATLEAFREAREQVVAEGYYRK